MTSRLPQRAAVLLTTLGLALSGLAAASADPVDEHPWGVYTGRSEFTWPPYQNAEGKNKRLLGRIAHAPKAKWFGHWIPNREIGAKVREYVANATGGDRDVLVQMTLFRMVPWEQETCERLPTRREQRSYRDWYDRLARALGDTHALVVLQPDGPFAACAPRGSAIPSKLISYSARRLSELPKTSVYIDAGAADWPAGSDGVRETLDFLVPGGIRHARGFALNGTHYSATADEVRRGAAIARALEERGIPGKRFVVNTSGNGQPFEFGRYQGRDPLNAQTCRTPDDPGTCVALGIPPTTHVADERWGLAPEVRELAAQYADAYVWYGRPWLYRQNQPFVMDRALDLARTWQYRLDDRMTR
ncbi:MULTISPECIES: glycoside hydrolase family 6 protein [unclassified Nocardioides]|uniref:glycoside hydrolase family 6 protein n=1 Tax=unclassified Nocardioides TaxID=2615069 RepID=UPI0036074C1F